LHISKTNISISTFRRTAAKFQPDQKRLLALDGGGVLGLISLQVLKKIEDDLRPHAPDPEAFRLRDYFDYIGGTSTGAIIAAGLALGWTVDDLIRFYEKDGSKMFTRAWPWNKPFHKYAARPLSKLLRKQIGEETILDLQNSGRLSKSRHLLIVTHNLSTDSPWPLSTNPKAKYNLEDHPECNRKIPLWQLVRASAAAPTYFPPQEIELPRGVR
jgi:patatin-like phospholipase/acyl hydrolase